MMTHPSHAPQLGKLNRVNGQIEGIKRMIEHGQYCVDIMTQIRAARSALKSIELSVLETHMKSCLHNACGAEQTTLDEHIEAILTLLKKYE